MKLASYFTTENPRKVVCLSEDAPTWLKAAVYKAHNGDAPNDWIYAECQAAACAIDEGSLKDDDNDAHAEAQVDIYTKDLYQWAADMCLTSTYGQAQEYVEDMSMPEDTLDRIRAFQYAAILTIAQTIVQAWEENRDA